MNRIISIFAIIAAVCGLGGIAHAGIEPCVAVTPTDIQFNGEYAGDKFADALRDQIVAGLEARGMTSLKLPGPQNMITLQAAKKHCGYALATYLSLNQKGFHNDWKKNEAQLKSVEANESGLSKLLKANDHVQLDVVLFREDLQKPLHSHILVEMNFDVHTETDRQHVIAPMLVKAVALVAAKVKSDTRKNGPPSHSPASSASSIHKQ